MCVRASLPNVTVHHSILLVLGVAIGACARSDDERPVLARRAIPPGSAGCYEVVVDSSLHQRPDTVELTLAGLAASDSLVLGTSPWSVDSLADSIRIGIPVGMEFGGGTLYVLGFRAGSDTLRGRLVFHGDVGPPFIHDGGPAEARRVPCPRRAVESG